MPGFFDATCPKCRHRFGWPGELRNKPDCPKCGAKPDRQALEADQKHMDDFKRLLALRPRDATGDELRQQRLNAGLGQRQAAEQLGMTARQLGDIENNRGRPSDDEAARMASTYGLETTMMPPHLHVYFDGACEPRNPGGWCTYGWVVLADGVEIQTGHGVACPAGHKNSTNNFSEYCALGFALNWLKGQGWKGTLEIFGDSKLVVNQVAGIWACNSDTLRGLRDRCLDLLKDVATEFRMEWIPREQNTRCDDLSQQAYVEATKEPFPKRERKKTKS